MTVVDEVGVAGAGSGFLAREGARETAATTLDFVRELPRQSA
jgi:hypothetical protein